MTRSIPRKILITGATGFIGSRLFEVMRLGGAFEPRAFIHSTASASRISRFPLDFAIGDLADRASVERAMEGCDAVVHLAFGDRSTSGKGTENILRAAVRSNVSRFVHVSSVAVYGDNPPPESVSEDAPARRTNLPYGNEKLAQEHVVARYGKRFNLPFVILRPPNVCGPFSHFTLKLIEKIRSGKMAILDDGQNPCNMVYVDNLVEAILLALWKDEAVGQTFFATNREVVTWQKCIRDHAALIGADVPQVRRSEILAAPREHVVSDSLRSFPRVMFSGEFRSVLRQIPLFQRAEQGAYERFIGLPDGVKQKVRMILAGPTTFPKNNGLRQFTWADNYISAQARTVAHSSSKGQRLLGFRAPVSYEEGMTLTQAWLRSVGLI